MEKQQDTEEEPLTVTEATDGTDDVDGSRISYTRRKRGVKVSGKFMPPLDWERVEIKHHTNSPGCSYLHKSGLSADAAAPSAQPVLAHEQMENGKQKGNSQKEEEKSDEDWETASANEETKSHRIFVSKTGISKDTIEELKALLKESPLVTSRQKANTKSSLTVKNSEEGSREATGESFTDSKTNPGISRLPNGQKPSAVPTKDEPPTHAVETPHVYKQENVNIKPLALVSSTLPGHTNGRLRSKTDPALSSYVSENIKEFVLMNSSNPSEVDFMIEQVKQQITREDIRFIRFEASDLNGISRSKTIPARFFQEKVLHGIPMPRGYLEVIPSPHENEADHSGADEDILFMPDISTFRVLPWAAKTARVICDPCTVTGSPLLTSPRQVARLQLDHLRGLGFALRSSFTYEFCLYGFAQAPNTNATLPAATLLDNHDQSFVHELIEGMDGAGVVVDSFSSSRRPGQMEVTLRPEFGMGAADNAFAFRTGLKELARKREHAAGFSAPCSGPGNRGALTHSLWDARGTRNLFSDGQAAQGLSNAGRRWRAGLLQHAAALSGLALPGVGIPRAPGLGCSGSRVLHAKLHAGGGARLENRLASAVANPYLVLAATVAAGLDGLRGAAAADGATTSTVPVRPEDALRELERDHCIQRALGESFAQYFIAVKRLELKTQAPDGEGDKYLEYFI